jgi:hypothetical protein
LQLWDAASSWQQRLLFPIDGLNTDSLQSLDMAASQNAAPYAADARPLLQHARSLPNGQTEVLISGIDLTGR